MLKDETSALLFATMESPPLLGCRVGMVFLPNDDELEAVSRQILEDVVAAEGRCHIVGWRKVPVDREVVGRLARVTEPRIWQVCPGLSSSTLPPLPEQLRGRILPLALFQGP